MKNFALAQCAVEYRPIDWVKPYTDNPRVHPSKQKAMLEAAIFRSRHINPLLVKPDGELIAGALRLEVAYQMGLIEVPVIILSHLSDVECAALRIADNAIADDGDGARSWTIVRHCCSAARRPAPVRLSCQPRLRA